MSGAFSGIVGLSQRSLDSVTVTNNTITSVFNGVSLNGGGTAPVVANVVNSNITFADNDISAVTNAYRLRDLHDNTTNGPVVFNTVNIDGTSVDGGILRVGGIDGVLGSDAFANISGANTFVGTAGNDIVQVEGTGTISVNAGDGNDLLVGAGGADMLNGQGGDDSLTGGGGMDSLFGGAGSDSFTFATAVDLANAAIVDGGTQTDTLIVGSAGAGVTLVDTDFANVLSVENLVLTGGNNTVTLGAEALGAAAAGITSVVFESGDDLLTLTQAAVLSVSGGSGSDTVVGSGLNDTLFLSGVEVVLTNDGADIITFTDAAAATVDGGAGTDAVLLGNFVNALTATGVETITGGSDRDTIVVTGLAASSISGGLGNDIILGGGGNDTISAGEGKDFVNGGAGKDMINLAETTAERDRLLVADRESARLNFDEVSGFAIDTDATVGLFSSADTIDFGSLLGFTTIMAAGGVTNGVVSGQLAIDANSQITLTNALQLIENELHNQLGQQNGTAAFTYKTDTYVGKVTGADGVETFTDVVRLVGVTGVTQLIDVDGTGTGTAVGLSV